MDADTLFINQTELYETLNKFFINLKKDGFERKTIDIYKRKSETLEAYWREYLANHVKLCESAKFDHVYFVKGCFDTAQELYLKTKEIIDKTMDQLSEQQTTYTPSPRIPEREAGGQVLPHTQIGQQLCVDQPKPEERRSQPEQGTSSSYDVRPRHKRLLPSAVPTKLDELMKQQSINIKAFERTVSRLQIDKLENKWQFESALKSLDSRWSEIDKLHWVIEGENGDDEIYQERFTMKEETYYRLSERLNEKMWSVKHREKSTPQVDIPVFHGAYNHWVSFKDLFSEAIDKNPSMSNAQKMQFLKSKVAGEAERLIHHLQISSDNYKCCWEILNHRYGNKKLIFTSQISTLLGITSMQQQSMTMIKKLHDVAKETLHAIVNLGVDITTWDPLLVHLLGQKLDNETFTEYVESIKKPRELPSLQEFMDFLERKFTALEAARRKQEPTNQKTTTPQPSKSNHYNQNQKKNFPQTNYYQSNFKENPNCNMHTCHVSRSLTCALCNNEHGLWQCPEFLQMTPEQKLNKIQKLNFCLNCLCNHFNKSCTSTKRCRKCLGAHNTLLHEAIVGQSAPTSVKPDYAKTTNSVATKEGASRSSHVSWEDTSEILLATAVFKVTRSDGTQHLMRALIDQGSQLSLITENAAQTLGLKRANFKGQIFGVGEKENNSKGMIEITIQSSCSEFTMKTNVVIMNNLIKRLPNHSFTKPSSWDHIQGINLADPEFYISKPVDLLLGADVYSRIMLGGILRGSKDEQPIAQQTQFGWLLCGSIKPHYHCNVILNNTEDTDMIPLTSNQTPECYPPHHQLLVDLQKDQRDQFKKTNPTKTLRLAWKPQEDTFIFNSKIEAESPAIATKKSLPSDISKPFETIFEPLNKVTSIPRLELMGAPPLTQLMQKVQGCLSDYHIDIYCWTDSTAVLGWIQDDPTRWKSFVSNTKLTTITKTTPYKIYISLSNNQNYRLYFELHELRCAKLLIIKTIQIEEFASDVDSINKYQKVHSKSKILNLNTIIDEHGILKVRGRLRNACIDLKMKHPTILPHDHRLTTLIINQARKSRPLCALTEDPDDLNYIKPAHLLSGKPRATIIETTQDARTRWHLTSKLFQDLWKRWKTEYLVQLSSRNKWMEPQKNLVVGDLVVIQDENLPPGKWALGRVIDTHPGDEGLTRAVSLKTKNGVMKRPIVKLSILPVNQKNEPATQPVNTEPATEVPNQTTTKVPERKGRKISTLATILLGFMMLLSSTYGIHEIKQLPNNQTLYFDPISKIRLIRDKWTMVVYYDMGPYWTGVGTYEKMSSYMDKLCATIDKRSHCNTIVQQGHHDYQELEYYNGLLLTQHFDVHARHRRFVDQTKQRRRRRGLINGIGYLANDLFGVLDSRFADQYIKDIETIHRNEKHLSNLWKNQTSIIESEFNLMKKMEDTIDKQHKLVNRKLMELQDNASTLQREIQNISYIQEFTLSAMAGNNLLQSLKRLQETLLDTITDIYHGQISMHLLTPTQLRQELQTISAKMPSELTLPINNLDTDLQYIYKLLKVKARATQRYVVIEITFPLIGRESYQLYKLIPIPHQMNTSMINIIPVSEYVAVNLKKDSHFTITTNELSACLHHGPAYMCQVLKPIRHIQNDENFCEINASTKECMFTKSICADKWIELHASSQHLYFCCDIYTIKILCDDRVTVRQLSRAGVISMSQDCIIKGKDFSVYSIRHQSNQINITPAVFMPEFDQINHLINLKLPDNESTSNKDSLNASITSLGKDVEKLKNSDAEVDDISPHDIHHYVTTYVLLAGALCAAAVWAYRSQRCCRRRGHAAEQRGEGRCRQESAATSPPPGPQLRRAGRPRQESEATLPALRPTDRPIKSEVFSESDLIQKSDVSSRLSNYVKRWPIPNDSAINQAKTITRITGIQNQSFTEEDSEV